MRNSATALGMIGGILALIMGIISFGYTELTAKNKSATSIFYRFRRTRNCCAP